MSAPVTPTRLEKFFAGNAEEGRSRWEKLWDAGDHLPFDRGFPNPALEDTLMEHKDVLGTATEDPKGIKSEKRKRALVPGCGRGYHVRLLASFGYDTYGLEISETALKRAKEEQEKNGERYPVRDEAVGKGKASFIHGDFFNPATWNSEHGKLGGGQTFDLIYDYTFLSALHPSMRPAWSKQMRSLLTPQGCLICIEFPTHKPPSSGGPPWALPPLVYTEHLSHPGEDVPYGKDGEIQVDRLGPPSRDGFKRLAHWQPQRTHSVGSGTDWVSIWRLDRKS